MPLFPLTVLKSFCEVIRVASRSLSELEETVLPSSSSVRSMIRSFGFLIFVTSSSSLQIPRKMQSDRQKIGPTQIYR